MKKFILIFVVMLFFTCDNEIDINAAWRDTPVVYAIFDSGSEEDGDGYLFEDMVNPEETIWDGTTEFDLDDDNSLTINELQNQNDFNNKHFVRVQKSFLGPMSANSYMDVSDSLYYNPNDLNVWVELVDILTGEVTDMHELELASFSDLYELNKDDGDFSTDGHYLFKLPDAVSNLCYEDDCNNMPKKYRVSVVNNITGEIASAETNIVQPLSMSKPNARYVFTLSYFGHNKTFPIKIEPSKNAKAYSVVLRFNYLEQTKSGYDIDKVKFENGTLKFPETQVEKKYIEWNIVTNRMVSDQDQVNGIGGTIDEFFTQEELLTQLSNKISKQNMSDPEYYRYPLYSFIQESGNTNSISSLDRGIYHRCVDIHITAVNSEFATYLNSNLPSYTVNQERPQYNNVDNGVGHVSSRSQCVLTNLRINNIFQDVISASSITKELNFACYDDDDSFQIRFNCQPPDNFLD